jgi:hypothetical protein
MKGRTILILILMLAVVLITSAVGAYQDQDDDQDQDKHNKHKKHSSHSHHNDNEDDAKNKHSTDIAKGDRTIDASNLTGASGAGMSHKVSQSHLDTSVRANGPYVDDGANTYKGKARGYTLHDNSDDSRNHKHGGHDSDSDDNSNSGDSDSDSDSGGGNKHNESDFTRKLKYIKKTISNLFKEIFSKWGNQGSIMAPSGIEELNPDTMSGVGMPGTLEGLTIRDKIKKQARQGMRKVRNAFRGRR